jgi:stage V sporulation protein AA
MGDVVYLKLSESCLAEKRKVKVKDVAKVVCHNPDVKFAVESMEIMSFSGTKEQQVVSVMYILEMMQQKFPECQTITLGATEVVIYYRTYNSSKNMLEWLKFVLVAVIAFVGAGFSIMSYNSDVNMVGQLEVMQNIFVGDSENAFPIAGAAYSLGLFVGIILFFNHGARKKFTDDPTPLQVQMRQYEKEVNQAIVVDSERKKDVRDAD